MSSSNFFGRDKLSRENLKSFIEGMRQGDNESRNDFIDENKTFILKVVSTALKKSTLPQNSKEFEIGLASFNYAIDTYDFNSDDDFLSYAEKVIKNSIYDYIKLSGNNLQNSAAKIENEYLYRDSENKNEICDFKLKLWKLDITLDSLVEVTPNDNESIITSISIARRLLSNRDICNKILSKAGIPYDQLDKDTRNNKKFIEKHKAYIIALMLILSSDMGILKSYLKNVESGNRSSDNIGIILEIFKDKALFFTLQGKFTINHIKITPDTYIGKQVLINVNNTKRTSNIARYSVFAAGFFAVTLTVLLGFTYFSRDDATTVHSPEDGNSNYTAIISENEEQNTSIPAATVTSSVDPSPTAELDTQSPDYATISPTPEKLNTSTTKSKSTNTPKLKSTNTPKPKRTNTPVPTKKTPEPTPPTDKAVGPPDTPVITCDVESVTVGDTYTVSMNMPSGNNGTVVVLYENDNIVLYKRHKDNSPNQQTESMSFKAKSKGTFKYRYKLLNAKGATSSETITVTVN